MDKNLGSISDTPSPKKKGGEINTQFKGCLFIRMYVYMSACLCVCMTEMLRSEKNFQTFALSSTSGLQPGSSPGLAVSFFTQ